MYLGIKRPNKTAITKQFLLSLAEEDERGCLIWKRSKTKAGYGVIGLPSGKTAIVTRVMWEICNGPFDKKLFVCHVCDNPSCLNPNHLFLGTAKDNSLDSIKKNRFKRGRAIRGADHPNSKLSENDVRTIRASTDRYSVLIKKYGISKTAVKNVRYKKSYANVD